MLCVTRPTHNRLCVFRRALNRFAIIKRGVNEIAMLIPDEELTEIRRRIALAKSYILKARGLVASAIGDNDRGMGPTSDFTCVV